MLPDLREGSDKGFEGENTVRGGRGMARMAPQSHPHLKVSQSPPYLLKISKFPPHLQVSQPCRQLEDDAEVAAQVLQALDPAGGGTGGGEAEGGKR